MTPTAWDELVAAAVVGTERREVPFGATEAVAALLGTTDLAAMASASTDQQLLAMAGVLAAWRRAGWRPPRGGAGRPPTAPPHDRAEASPRANQVLELLLAGHLTLPGGPAPLLAEWLGRCATAGRRPPDALLPRLLEMTTPVPDLREPVRAAGGARVRWLAAQNPDWRWASDGVDKGDDPADVWASAEPSVRFDLLRRLRATEPDAARALLDETWATERAADRARFLDALAIGLSPADEPFLEAALDDRAKSVRVVAADQLARLPTSRLAGRMADRLRPLVRTGGRFRRRLDVELPDELDDDAARDSITDDGAPPKTGVRAWRLIQLVGAAPLDLWAELTEATPEEIVRLGHHTPELARGWSVAAVRQRNVAWARALLRDRADPALVSVLPAPLAHDELAALLAVVPDAAVPGLLETVPGPWPVTTSQVVLRRVRAAKNAAAVNVAVHLMAARLHPATMPEVDQWLSRLGEERSLQREVTGLAHALSIRATIAEEFSI